VEGMTVDGISMGSTYFSARNGNLITSLSIRIFRLDLVLERRPKNLLNSFADNILGVQKTEEKT